MKKQVKPRMVPLKRYTVKFYEPSVRAWRIAISTDSSAEVQEAVDNIERTGRRAKVYDNG